MKGISISGYLQYSSLGRLVVPVLLCGIILVAFWARVSGTNYGLPYVGYVIDEYLIGDKAIAMLNTGNLDPRQDSTPMFEAYVQAAVGKTALWYRSLLAGKEVPPREILLTGDSSRWGGLAGVPEFYQWGRVAVATMGTFTVLLVYLITRNIYGSQAGLIAAAFLALAPLHERESKWITRDVPATFLIVLSFFVMVVGVRRQRYWLLAVGCALAGLAIYAKSNGRIVLVPLFLFLLVFFAKGRTLRLRDLSKVTIGFALVVLSAAPFYVGDLGRIIAIPDYILRPIWENSYVYGGSHPGFDGSPGWERTVEMLTYDSWRFVAFFSLAGVVWLLFRNPVWTAIVASIPIANFVVFSFFTVRFDRWLLPMIPFMAILAGAFLWDSTYRAVSRLRLPRSLAPAICFVVGFLLLMGPYQEVRAHHSGFAVTDIRAEASKWIASNLEPGSKIAVENYSPAVSDRVFKSSGSNYLIDRDIDWYRQEGFDYLVASSGAFGRFFANRTAYQAQSEQYETLFREFPIVKEFSGLGPNVKVLKVQGQAITLARDEDSPG